MNRVISLLFLLFASLSLKAQELPKPSQKWTMGANAHFQVLSTVSNSETTELVEDFEQFRAMLHGVLGEGAAKGSLMELPARIYLFQDSRQFDRYTSLTSRVGFFAHDPQGFRMALIASESEARRIVYHEYFHYHLRRVAPDLVPPLWANEGLACFYETARFEKKNVIIGIADANRLLSLFQRQPMPMSQLVNVHHRSPEYTVEAETQRFYATSWLAAHYLTIGNVNRRRQLPEYLGRIRAGQSQEQAFVAAFKTTYSGLDEELFVYLRSLRMSTPVFKAPPQAALDLKPLELGPASYAEALAQLGMLLGQQPEKQNFAKAHFQKALEVDPRCATAMAGLSQLEPEKARSLLDGAIALRPDPMFWLMRARLGFGQGAITEEGLEAILSDLASAARQGVGDAYHLEPVTYILPAGPRLSAQGLDSVRD
ncbi:MAG: hypothetical protein LWX11_06985, partial [Firmicutes bacterium]|nr:hypothetical protein [Bacillota bacterium]